MVIESLLNIAKNIDEEDYIRVEALKDMLLEIEDYPLSTAEVSKALIAIIINKNDDVIVRQHAANELYHYIGDSCPDKNIINVILDQTEDINLKVNLCEALRDDESSIKYISQNLKETDDLNKYI